MGRGGLLLGAALFVAPVVGGAQSPSGATVTGRVELQGGGAAGSVAQTVVWLEGPGLGSAAPMRVGVGTEDKEFLPHVTVVPAGSLVDFPNHDPFDHNVFSSTSGSSFDLGLYGRGETRSQRFDSPGVVHVYCNVHAEMSALVVVLGSRFYTRPAPDGSFRLEDVPVGRWRLHVWHERAPEVMREIVVGPDGTAAVGVTLDARPRRVQPHLNKYGRPYPAAGRRY
jgi:plastocyanin